MDEDLIVSATFTPKRTISVTVSGDGTVTSTPAGIECTAGPTCSWTFRADDGQVVLTAAGGTFLGWGGDCEERGIETTCTLSLDADHRADASFSSPTPEAEP